MAMSEPNSDKKPESYQKGPKEKPLTKVVIRRLPPKMDQDTFLNQIAPVPSYDYFYMVQGDPSMKEHSFGRAYINFVNHEDVFDFKEKFDNYVFLDDAGHEYPAVVEYAPFQKIPKKRNKNRMDPKIGTIESDPYYLEFVESLNKPPEPEEKPEFSLQLNSETKNAETTTPLLEFVKQRRVEKMRMREERREERKRKDFERKKFRDDERRKHDEKSPMEKHKNQQYKSTKDVPAKETSKSEESIAKSADKDPVVKEESKEKYASTSNYKGARDRKYDDRNKKENRNKYPPKREYTTEKREFKSQRRDDYKKYDEYKKEDSAARQQTTAQNKKVKKYSEKREERKIEAQKAAATTKQEQGGKEQQPSGKATSESAPSQETAKKEEHFQGDPPKDVGAGDAGQQQQQPGSNRRKENDSQSRRIRNKDRPTIAIYRPGMLSKKKHTDGDSETKERKD